MHRRGVSTHLAPLGAADVAGGAAVGEPLGSPLGGLLGGSSLLVGGSVEAFRQRILETAGQLTR